MPQAPLGAAIVNAGGNNSDLNNTTAQVIKSSPGRLRRVVINNAGSGSGAFTFNDCATLAAANAANQILTMPFNATDCFAGSIVVADIVCKIGLVMSAVPAGGSPSCGVFFD